MNHWEKCQENDLAKKNTIKGVHFQIIQCVLSNKDLKLFYKFMDFKQGKMAARKRKEEKSYPSCKGEEDA